MAFAFIGYLDLNEDDELYSDLESESENEENLIDDKAVEAKGTFLNIVTLLLFINCYLLYTSSKEDNFRTYL